MLVRTCPHWWGPLEIEEVLDDGQEPVISDVESSELGGGGGGVFLLLILPVGALLALALAAFCSDGPLAAGLLLWAVIITICEAARMLSSSVENLSARQYNSSIVAGRSRDKD